MKIAIVGAGISGITAAHCLGKSGHEVTVFEKSTDLGGVWALGYPGVSLQNTERHYRISDVPWPFAPDLHPTGGQIRDYLEHVVTNLRLDVRRGHEVLAMHEESPGWSLKYRGVDGVSETKFDFVVVAIGQYTEGKHRPEFPGESEFSGEIITERDLHDLDMFNGKRVAVVGFGKSAIDMATFAVGHAQQVYHVFRTPRWLIPFHILGLHYAHVMFCRMATIVMPSWAHPTGFERFLHKKLGFLVAGCLWLAKLVLTIQCRFQGLGKSKRAKAGLKTVLPQHGIIGDLRSAAALAPEHYYRNIADEKILPFHSELDRFVESGLKLKDGRVIDCDQVVLSLGSESPKFPFFPDLYRTLLEAEDDGVQLYRHLLHPLIPNIAFAGFNHGFMHVPAVEVGMLWLSAYLDGDLKLPSNDQMQQSISRVLAWKRRYIHYEPSRSCAVNTRFQQYLDIMLKDLGISPYRKLPNVFAEVFSQYGAADYQGLWDEYKAVRERVNLPMQVQAVDT